MQNDALLTDDYVADLLVQDADRSLRYSAMGLEAFNAKSKPTSAAKPNTKFLRHIIRDTDNHNRALLAREAAESRARLRDLERSDEARRRRLHPASGEVRKRQLGDIQSILGARRGDKRDGGGARRLPQRDEDIIRENTKDRRDYGRLSRSERHDDDDDDGDDDDRRGKRRSHRHRHEDERRSRRSRREGSSSDDGRQHRHRSRSPAPRHRHGHRDRRPQLSSRSRSRSRSPGEKRSRHRHRSTRPRDHDADKTAQDDSDPLEELIGPAPPPRYRGRGKVAGAAGMDMRFSEAYDPRADVLPAEGEEQEQEQQQGADWEDAVEAFRDRQRLRQARESRMRAAGFEDAQIRRLEGRATERTERTEEDVVWSKAGEEREWDRGKEDGR